MKKNTILWHPTRLFHYCIVDGDSVEYSEDAKGRRIAQCVACGNKLVVISASERKYRYNLL